MEGDHAAYSFPQISCLYTSQNTCCQKFPCSDNFSMNPQENAYICRYLSVRVDTPINTVLYNDKHQAVNSGCLWVVPLQKTFMFFSMFIRIFQMFQNENVLQLYSQKENIQLFQVKKELMQETPAPIHQPRAMALGLVKGNLQIIPQCKLMGHTVWLPQLQRNRNPNLRPFTEQRIGSSQNQ